MNNAHAACHAFADDYTWNLDPIRVPAKYPGKRNFKPGPNYGKPSGNPLGKNPSDIWKLMVHEWETGLWNIPNVKANHPEKTLHPCSFPIELVERCVLAMTNEGDVVLDPFSGVGSAMLAALKRGRRSIGIDKERKYIDEAMRRINMLASGVGSSQSDFLCRPRPAGCRVGRCPAQSAKALARGFFVPSYHAPYCCFHR